MSWKVGRIGTKEGGDRVCVCELICVTHIDSRHVHEPIVGMISRLNLGGARLSTESHESPEMIDDIKLFHGMTVFTPFLKQIVKGSKLWFSQFISLDR